MNPEVQTGFVDLGESQLYFEIAGQGERTIVLIHGFTLDCRMWAEQFELLAEQYRVLRYDMRGYGQFHTPTDQPYNAAADLKALLDQLNISPITLVGFSLGGAVATNFTLAHPQYVEQLVLVDAALDGHHWSKEWRQQMKAIWQQGRAGQLAAARDLWRNHPLFAHAPPDSQARDLLEQMVADYSGWHWTHRDPEEVSQPPASEQLSRIVTPTLIVVGQHDLPDFQEIAALLTAQLPHSQKALVPDAGHMTPLEQPAFFNRLLLGFLAD